MVLLPNTSQTCCKKIYSTIWPSCKYALYSLLAIQFYFFSLYEYTLYLLLVIQFYSFSFSLFCDYRVKEEQINKTMLSNAVSYFVNWYMGNTSNNYSFRINTSSRIKFQPDTALGYFPLSLSPSGNNIPLRSLVCLRFIIPSFRS